MITISLSNKRIFLKLTDLADVDLLFKTSDRYFYLLLIAMVAKEMRAAATKKQSIPFVPFSILASRALALSKKTKSRPFENVETMAKTIYQTWKRALSPTPGSKNIFEPSRKLTDEEEYIIEQLFEVEPGKANEHAAYRINFPARKLTINDYDILEDILNEKGIDEEANNREQMIRNIPNKPFYTGIKGHEFLTKDSLKILEDGTECKSLLIWGMGGLGKSTIAAEVIRRYTKDCKASFPLWVTANVPRENVLNCNLSFKSQVYDSLLPQLDLLSQIYDSDEDKAEAVKKSDILSDSILVIDDFSHAQYNIKELSALIEELNPKKVLITSRPELALYNCRSIKVSPLDNKDSIRFITKDTKRRRIENVLPKQQEAMVELANATGGLPFAIQLALAQATRLPWHKVVEGCVANHSELYFYLFRDIWKSLNLIAQKTLIYMRTAPDNIALEELLAGKKLGEENQIIEAVDTLVKLALMDVKHLDDSSAVYSIHPLTYNFIVSDLPQIWSEEDDKRQ